MSLILPNKVAMLQRLRQPTWINHNSSVANASSYDFGDFTFPVYGHPVIAALGYRAAGASQVSGVTVGGVALTSPINVTNAIRARGIWVGGGDNVVWAPGAKNVTVTFNQTMEWAAVGVWHLSRYAYSGLNFSTGAQPSTASPATSLDSPAMDFYRHGYIFLGGIHDNSNALSFDESISQRVGINLETRRATFADRFGIIAHSSGNIITTTWSGSVNCSLTILSRGHHNFN